MHKLFIAAALSAALAMPAMAQGTAQKKSDSMAASPSEEEFVKKAAITNMFEIQAGQIAQKKANVPAISDYAQMIIEDHQKLQSELKQQAEKVEGVTVPSELDQKHKQMVDKLQSASGAQFLKTFKAQQVSGHQEAIKLFQNYAKAGENDALKQLAQSRVDALQKHLQVAQNLPTSPRTPTTGQGQDRQPRQQ